MKNLKFITPILVLMLTLNSCIIDRTRYDDVNACFSVSGTEHFVNEPVYFVNCSQYADSYEWTFGDGTISNERNPTHYYTDAGNYQVKLTAFNNASYESFSMVVSVYGSTDLDILVMFDGTEVPFPNATVTIFDSESDWDNLINPIADVNTDSKGIALFLNLDPIIYYIDAYKDHASDPNLFYSNYLLGYATDALIEDDVNFYNIYVELLSRTKSVDRKEVEITKIEKSSKDEHDRIINAWLNK